jgi:glycosyltransferase involved in cell wall biosynthesis
MNNTVRPRLLIFNDFFYPAYQAGGPIQSLVNLIIHLNEFYEISVITSAYDLHATQPMENIQVQQWNSVLLPGAADPIKVWYADIHKSVRPAIRDAVKNFKPDVVYINGMFSFRFVMLPLMLIKNIKMVISPRGMIQDGALSGKYLKKKIYLSVLRSSGLIKNVWWHATTDVEAADAKKLFGENTKTVVAGNIPRIPVKEVTFPQKKAGELRLIYLSLITAKKNLLQAIESINSSKENISLHIYGPVKDVSYWEKCEQLMKRSGGRIEYKGPVIPQLVQSTFASYDAGLFLTKAENFGHALYESLSAGRPIITSFFTPWDNLEIKKAGWNVDIDSVKNIVSTLEKAAAMDNAEFSEFCKGAHRLANDYFNDGFDIADYKKLF